MRVLALLATSVLPAQSWLPKSPFPAWSNATPKRVIQLSYDGTKSPTQNGDLLEKAVDALVAGDALAIGPGTWSVPTRWEFTHRGTAQDPIWIVAKDPNNRPVITRPDARQNTVNIGSSRKTAQYLCLRGLEITGGSDLVRILHAHDIWIDQCYIHTGEGGISCNTVNTSYMYFTRNEIARPGTSAHPGEAMYLGSDDGKVIFSHSVVAYNHIHHTTAGRHGDGIEIKQNCHHVWVLGNHVHDTKYPCIVVAGTGGNDVNVIEGNVCYNSRDAVLQVQGEALVRNNIAIHGASSAFSSHDHKAKTTKLTVVHNTFLNTGIAANLAHWNGRSGMIFANNVCYSARSSAIRFGSGSNGVTLAGNVVLGSVYRASTGFVSGSGLTDFRGASFDATRLDVVPVVGGAIDNRGRLAFAVPTDALGQARSVPVDPGAVANADVLLADITVLDVTRGGTQNLAFRADVSLAGKAYLVLGSATPATTRAGAFELDLGIDAWFHYTLANPNSATLQNTLGQVSATGQAFARIALPALPASMRGLDLRHALLVFDGTQVAFASNAAPLQLR